MTIKEKKKLAKIVYDFIDCHTGINGGDSAIVANNGVTSFNKIIKEFDIGNELKEEINTDPYLKDEDFKYLMDYITSIQ